MVECELLLIISGEHLNRVLIDTWWNVNNRYFLTQVVNKKVLIDTWWNVNHKRG